MNWSTAMLREIAEYIWRLADEIDTGKPVTQDDNKFFQSLCKVFWAERAFPITIRERKEIEAIKGLWKSDQELQIEPHSNC